MNSGPLTAHERVAARVLANRLADDGIRFGFLSAIDASAAISEMLKRDWLAPWEIDYIRKELAHEDNCKKSRSD